MKLAVSGSRFFWCYEVVEKYIDMLHEAYGIELIITGGAPGVDTLAEAYARTNLIPLKVYHAEWGKYGKRAEPIRNNKIIKECDMLLAFPAKNSTGTIHAINAAKIEGKRTLVIDV